VQAYDYSALDAKGKACRGTITADGEPDARQRLKARQLFPVEIKPARGRSATGTGFIEKLFTKQERIRAKDLSLFTRQLATMVQAAAPIEEALHGLAQQAEKKEVRAVITRIRSSVLEGMRLSQAMAQEPESFDKLYRAMVAAGEVSGNLGGVLSRVADHHEKNLETRGKVQSALIYPAVLMFVAIGVVTALMVFVVPKVVEQFDSFGGELPVLTQIVIALSDFITNYGLFVLVGICVAVFGFGMMMRKPAVRYAVHLNMLKWPVIGRLIRSVNAARLARAFGTLVQGGSPALDAFVAANKTVHNVAIRHAVQQSIEQVREGAGVATSLRRVALLPPMVAFMAASGEQSGQLGLMLHKTADYLEAEFDGFTKAALSLLEPMIVILMGGLVGAIVLSIMLPILRLNSLVMM